MSENTLKSRIGSLSARCIKAREPDCAI